QNINASALGGTIYPNYQNPANTVSVTTAGNGSGSVSFVLGSNPILVGLNGYAQVGILDGGQPFGWAFSNGLEFTFCN
ncbi:MAG: SH3 domain-containing protein, partial [Planctomycetota bacterium]